MLNGQVVLTNELNMLRDGDELKRFRLQHTALSQRGEDITWDLSGNNVQSVKYHHRYNVVPDTSLLSCVEGDTRYYYDCRGDSLLLLKSEFKEDPLEGYDKVTLSFVAFIEKKDFIISFPKKVNSFEELNIGEGSMEWGALYALVFWEKLQSFEDDETGDLVYATMSGKDLFQVGEGVITVFDDVTSADNIVYTITDKNREDFKKEMELSIDPFANYKTIQIKFEFGTMGIGGVEADSLDKAVWYTLDGKKLSGEPTRKGVYIYKGKKVVKKAND